MSIVMINSNNYYDRQIKLHEIGEEGQRKLNNARVLVIGAGGLGSPVLNYLVIAGVGNIAIYDHDTIDESNLHRQILFTPDDIGLNKAEVSKLKLSKINPLINIHANSTKFDTDVNISEYDIIVECTDSLRTKFGAHDLAFKHNKKFIVASLHKFEGQIQSFDFSVNKSLSPCMRCLWGERPDESGVETCEEVGVLGAVPGVIGTMQALEVLKTILGINRLTNEDNLILNLIDFSSIKLKLEKKPNCILCSGNKKDFVETDEMLEINYDEAITDKYLIVSLVEQSKIKTDLTSNIGNIIKDTTSLQKDNKIAVVCNRGITSLNATKLLRENGFINSYSVKGGLQELK
jgi:adenylyltransferase/sulfurtransferase